MTFLEKENFRLQSICRITENGGFEELSVKEGLAIEKKVENKLSSNCQDYYYVIGFVYPNNEGSYFEDAGLRLLDIENNEFNLFKDLIICAKNLVDVANKE